MKQSMSKRVICVVLSLIMLAAYPLSASAAYAAPSYAKTQGCAPVVVVNGYQHNILYNYPMSGTSISKRAQQVFPPEEDKIITLINSIVSYVEVCEGNYSKVTDLVFPQVCGVFTNLYCNPDGSVRDNLGVKKLYKSLAYYKDDAAVMTEIAGDLGKLCADEIGYDMVYVFTYDWRISPMLLADELNTYIEDTVKAQTGYDEVTIVAEGMGANVTSAYMSMYQKDIDYAGIDNYVLINSAAQGMTTIGALYTGQIDVDPNGIVRLVNDASDYLPVAFMSWITMYVLNNNFQLYKVALQLDTYLMHEKTRIYDDYVRAVIKDNAGLWSLIPWTEDDHEFENAIDFIFPSGAELNDTFMNRVYAYHEVQRTAADVLIEMEEAGKDVSVVSGYGMQFLPIVDGLNEQKSASETSDGYIDTKYSSFGATCAYLNSEWVGYEIDNQQILDGHNHLNTDSIRTSLHQTSVDASTCALPESTWLVYGLKNDYLHANKDDAHYFLSHLIFSTSQTDVWDNPYYPQFMTYNRFADALYVNSKNDVDYLRLPGDVNLDGRVVAADARLALRHAAELLALSGIRLENANVNEKDDGVSGVSAADARIILRIAAGLQ